MFAETLKVVDRGIKRLVKHGLPSVAIYMIEEEKKKAMFLRCRSKELSGDHKRQCYNRSLEHINNCIQMIGSAQRYETQIKETKCQK